MAQNADVSYDEEEYVYGAHYTIFRMFSSDTIDPGTGRWADAIDTIEDATYSVKTGLLIDE